MPGLTETRDAAVVLLREQLAVCVEGIAGSCDAAAILSRLVGKNAILVMALSAVNDSAYGALDFSLKASFAALVVAHGGRDKTAREDEAMALAERAALVLHGSDFGLSGVSPAYITQLAPLADAKLDDRGMRAWAITWEQSITS